VRCNQNDMTVSLRKEFIPDFYLEDLGLLDAMCEFARDANYTHFKLVIPLVSCGTVSHHTNTTILYTNVIQNKPIDENVVINRLPALEIPIRCSYPKKVCYLIRLIRSAQCNPLLCEMPTRHRLEMQIATSIVNIDYVINIAKAMFVNNSTTYCRY
jgi:hypothetical protein